MQLHDTVDWLDSCWATPPKMLLGISVKHKYAGGLQHTPRVCD